jgi:SAM-dependent methyltransferase
MVDMADYSRRYIDQYAEDSFETVLVQIRREAVLSSLARHPHRRIVEVGCGFDALFPHLDDFDRFSIVEPSEEFVDAARVAAASDDRVMVHQGFLEEVAPQLDLTPDFVVVSSLLHEVPDPQGLLAAVRSLCGAETVVHLNVPNMMSFHRLLAVEMGLIPTVFTPSQLELQFQRQSQYDMTSLLAAVTQAGFRVEVSGSYFLKPFSHAQMQAMLKAGIIDESVLAGLTGMVRHLPLMGCELYVELKADALA